jgi:glycosyltransferase involved in cell wall biosynthesis
MGSILVYVLLSPTFGMHQYTADLAHQALMLGHEVHVVTTSRLPRDRYMAQVQIHTPVAHCSTGFTGEGARPLELGRLWRCIKGLRPDRVHFTGAHLWNPLLLAMLRQAGYATIHTLHDLDPHIAAPHGRLIRLWNWFVIAAAHQLLVHAERYQQRLLRHGRSAACVHAWPLSHTFLGAGAATQLCTAAPNRTWEPWVLFFGRLEVYKGINVLLAAAKAVAENSIESFPSLVLAGRGVLPDRLPPGVIHLDRHIDDALGCNLFQRCRALVLPYTSATQSALPATAYAFGKPVIVADSGALAEVVIPGKTGWVVPSNDAPALAVAIDAVRVATPSTLAGIGEAGRQKFEKLRQVQAEKLAALYAG